MILSPLKNWIAENYSAYSTREAFVAECMKETGASRRQINDAVSKLRCAGKLKEDTVAKPSRARRVKSLRTSVDVSEIKREYDDEGKLMEGIDALGTALIKDNDFRVELGISVQRWKPVTDRDKFAKYRIDLRGKKFHGLYWGRPEVIQELRRSIDLV